MLQLLCDLTALGATTPERRVLGVVVMLGALAWILTWGWILRALWSLDDQPDTKGARPDTLSVCDQRSGARRYDDLVCLSVRIERRDEPAELESIAGRHIHEPGFDVASG